MWSLFSGGYKGTAISNVTHATMEINKSVMGTFRRDNSSGTRKSDNSSGTGPQKAQGKYLAGRGSGSLGQGTGSTEQDREATEQRGFPRELWTRMPGLKAQ